MLKIGIFFSFAMDEGQWFSEKIILYRIHMPYLEVIIETKQLKR